MKKSPQLKLSDELRWRGLIKDKTFSDSKWLDEPKTFYLGIDGSADSLTIGNLALLMLSQHLIKYGWKPILLVGGATTLIGDPGGKKIERTLPKKEDVKKNIYLIEKQINKLFKNAKFKLVNNIDWHENMFLLDFLRDIGKHFSVTELIQREYIAERLGKNSTGISYAEFSYGLIQGYDYLHLNQNYNAYLQIGGSDQWGNMLSGVDLIRKKLGKQAHALSMPLVINKVTGQKFGKSEEGSIWLDPGKSSVTKFYQFWINTPDDEVEDYLKIFTLLTRQSIEDVIKRHRLSPEKRYAQKKLANEVTKLVHGHDETHTAEVVTSVLNSEVSVGKVSEGIIKKVKNEIASIVAKPGSSIIDSLVSSGLAVSKTEARRLVSSKAIYINNQTVSKEEFLNDQYENGRLILRRGKAFKDSALVEDA